MIKNGKDFPDKDKIADFCGRNHIYEISLFGSVLWDDFEPENDMDLLVEFEPDQSPRLLPFIRCGRRVVVSAGRMQG